MTIVRNAFQLIFRRQYEIQRILNNENRFFELFRHYLQDVKSMRRESQEFIIRRTRVLQLDVELVIKTYIQNILALLTTRFDCAERDVHRRIDRSLIVEEVLGLGGLTPAIIGKFTSCSPHFVLTRTPQSGAFFEQYHTGLWTDKLKGLFAFDDEPRQAIKRRSWENASFRQLTRRLHTMIVAEWSSREAQMFIPAVAECASSKLWLVPQYDVDKLSVMRKASKHNTTSTQRAIESLSSLERTNWLMPHLDPRFFPLMREVERGHSGLSPPDISSMSLKQQASYKEIRKALLTQPRFVWSEENHAVRHHDSLINSEFYKIDVDLDLAEGFHKELNEQTINSDSTTSSSKSEVNSE